jgi:NADH:ubiquinone oxidoreductase subunit 3 (subunit A)
LFRLLIANDYASEKRFLLQNSPWAVSLSHIGLLGFWSMMVFLGVLTIGFIYEWKKGALDWE